jgi:hypothetical protein
MIFKQNESMCLIFIWKNLYNPENTCKSIKKDMKLIWINILALQMKKLKKLENNWIRRVVNNGKIGENKTE